MNLPNKQCTVNVLRTIASWSREEITIYFPHANWCVCFLFFSLHWFAALSAVGSIKISKTNLWPKTFCAVLNAFMLTFSHFISKQNEQVSFICNYEAINFNVLCVCLSLPPCDTWNTFTDNLLVNYQWYYLS